MKKIIKRFIYILSVIFIITGFLLMFPGQIFGCIGDITLTKNINAPQGTDTVFTFTVSPDIGGRTEYTVTVPAGSTTGSTTINNVPGYYEFTWSENSLAGWTLVSSSNTTFTIIETDLSHNPTFNNSKTEEPESGTVTITKNIAETQGADTVFIITVNPAIDGNSSYSVTVPAGSSTGSTTINNVPFDVPYTMSEDSLAGWTLDSSSNTSFTLTDANPTANPIFSNSTNTTTTVPATTTTVPATTTTTPTVGSIQIVKIITASQGSDTTFGFTITPAVNGQSSYSVVVPAGQTEARLTISNVPFGITYSIAETNIPTDWTLFQSEGTTFTLSVSAAFATPAFWNAPPGGTTTTAAAATTTTTTTGIILVAGITTGPGVIEVAGIQELPFSGQKDNLLKFGIGFIIMGIMMMILLPVFLRTGKHQVIK